MKQEETFSYRKMPDDRFGVDVFLKSDLGIGSVFPAHWHEYMQLYSFISGNAFLDCGGRQFSAAAGDITVINSNEVHYLKSLSDDLRFYVIRINLSFLFSSQPDLCQTKFIAPLSQNRITFCNLIRGDASAADCVAEMVREYVSGMPGYELAVKAAVYRLLVLLLRLHVRNILSPGAFSARVNSLKKFDAVLTYMETHYEERISAEQLAEKAHVTVCYFCRAFRQITGRTSTDYLNNIRLEKSTGYLRDRSLNVTEIALKCGFDSVNYYSRLFRRNYHVSPSEYRKGSTDT
jgi:AraC-like DNA-binding protein